MQRTVILVLVVIVLLLTPCGAGADARRFIPRISAFEANLDVEAEHERNKNTTDGQGSSTRSTVISERLVLSSVGHVYHPRFITFLAGLTGGLKQDESHTSSWHGDTLYEYELRAYVLPEHPYNLELFTLRREPTLTGRSLAGVDPVLYQKGGIFRYKERPIFFDMSYIFDDIESGQSDSSTETFNTNASYFTDTFHVGAGYSHSDSDSKSTGIAPRSSQYKTDRYYANNWIDFKEARLFSNLQYQVREERRSDGPREKDRNLQWTEQLDIYVPKNLETNLTYNHFQDTIETKEAGAADTARIYNKTHNPALRITHRLYESLTTNYQLNYIDTKTSGGEIKSTSHIGGVAYTKKLPWESRLNTGVTLGTMLTDSTGSILVLEEPFTATSGDPLLNFYTLKQFNADVNTISVVIRHPTITADRQPLFRGIHYDVEPFGTTFRIRVFSLAGITFTDASTPNPLAAQQFFVTYASAPGDYKLRTDTVAYNIQFSLYKNLFSPYFAFSRSKQSLEEGFIAGGPQTTTTKTAGAVVQKQPFIYLAEYMQFDSSISPLRKWRTELSYRQDVTETVLVDSRVRYEKTDYVMIAGEPDSGYSEELYGINISVQKRIPRRGLQIMVSGAYYRSGGPADTDTYVLNNLLTWRIGRLDLEAGANIIHTEATSSASTSKYTSQLYYLKFRRNLF